MAVTPKSTELSDGAWPEFLAFGTLDVRHENPGGLTGVWAEENTRLALRRHVS